MHEEPELKLGIPFQKLRFFLFFFSLQALPNYYRVENSSMMHEKFELKLMSHSKLAFELSFFPFFLLQVLLSYS